MNAPETNGPRRRCLTQLAWMTSIVLVLSLMVFGITGFVRLSPDARSLRNSLTENIRAQTVSCRERVEVHVGAITCQLLRAGLSFAPLPVEARTALRSVRGGEVGVYELGHGSEMLEPSEILAASDEVMRRRGWERLVGVVKERELVAVYVLNTEGKTSTLRACVAVLSRDHLIIAAVRSNLEPLMELAWQQPGWKQNRPLRNILPL